MVRGTQAMVEAIKDRILIIGKNGLLGHALDKELSPRFETHATTREELDITNREAVQELCRKLKPSIVILAAACTNVDFCEENHPVASSVNIDGFRNVARACKDIEAVLIAFSTDYVFDGKGQTPYREEDEALPVSYYGYTKLEGEKAVRGILPHSVIIRTAWLFGEGKKGFVPFVIEAAKEKRTLRVVSDKLGCATSVKDLASAVSRLLQLIKEKRYDFKKYGILHITNQGVCSWYDIAKLIADCLKADGMIIEKIKLSDHPFRAQRPQYSVLDISRFEKITKTAMRPWQEALKEFLQCL